MGKGQKAKLQAQQQAGLNLLTSAVPKAAAMTFVPGQGLVPATLGNPPVPHADVGVSRGVSQSSTVKPPTSQKVVEIKFDLADFLQSDDQTRADILAKLFVTKCSTVIIPSSVVTKSRSMQSLVHDMEVLTMKPSAAVADLTVKRASAVKAPAAPPLVFPRAVLDITSIAMEYGFTSIEGDFIIQRMTEQVNSDDSNESEKGLYLLKYLLLVFGRDIEPFVFELLSKLISLHMDRSLTVRDLAADVIAFMGDMLCTYSIFSVWETIVPLLTEETDWRLRVAALKLIKIMAPRVAGLISPLLPQIIPLLSECVGSAKKQVQNEAIDALTVSCSAISNDDIAPIVPQLVSVIARPEECAQTLDLLLETTFVSTVDAPTLALITPLLGKSLRGRSSVLWRKAARIIDNMCKLVNVSSDVLPFVPLLLPALEKAIDEVTDLEVCEVAKAARESLMEAASGRKRATSASVPCAPGDTTLSSPARRPRAGSNLNILSISNETELTATSDKVLVALKEGLSSKISLNMSSANTVAICNHVSMMTAFVILFYTAELKANNSGAAIDTGDNNCEVWRFVVSCIPMDVWFESSAPYLKPLLHRMNQTQKKQRAASIVDEESGDIVIDEDPAPGDDEGFSEPLPSEDDLSHEFRIAALGGVPDTQADNDEDASNLCNIKFSLAFGGKTLLYNTYLKLGRGRRYGVMGKNGTGKTTLLTNIGTGNIEGMPSDLRTVYVQHDDQTLDNGVPLLQELLATPGLVALGVTEAEAREALTNIFFTEQMLTSPRSSLSGGWKMKLLIIRAMLMRADVLLLDEPTNHLDAASVEWLGNYLNAQSHLTCMIVSHDTQFLDNVVTDIIHYEHKKLVYYHGSLTAFVKIHPEAKYYYDLEASSLKFTFPTPGRLDGISSNTRAILKMEGAQYTYPGASKPTISNVSVKVCLGSRIACRGVNGAGKSTLIKLLVQETEPDKDAAGNPIGEIWKHPNLRIAYVAQHSFHHVEEHLDKSPVDYMKQRFKGGVDSEELSKATVFVTDAELEERAMNIKYGDVIDIIGRRKNGRVMEYECLWHGQTKKDPNKYIAMETLIEMGLSKLVQYADAKVAALAAGLDVRPLLNKEIQGHLDEFNLEAEYGTHSKIRRLSGGQKVKLVLAAAMWNRPHVLVLDEPTNYLDREALGALTQAIKAFGGGVVIISHNKEFTDAICTETWMVENGKCCVEGEVEEAAVQAISLKKQKKEIAENNAESTDSYAEKSIGNLNATKKKVVLLKNPKTLEPLTKVEIRKLKKLAEVAGVTLEEYVGKINNTSPEWKWLSNTIK